MKKLPLAKQVTLALIVTGVAFVTSALLTLLAWWGSAHSGFPAQGPSPLIGLSFGTVAGVAYIALSGNKRVAIADDAARQAALAPVTGGKARLLVYREGFVGKLAGVDVYVDGEARTQLKSPRFAALDLTPGRHILETEVQNRRSDPIEIDAKPGEAVAVRIAVTFGKSKVFAEPDIAAVRAALAGIPMVQA